MTPLALYRQMLASGIDEGTAYAMAEQFEISEASKAEERYQALLSRLSVDVKAQARRDKDKERKREAAALRKSAEYAESAETPCQGSKEKVSPTPPSKTQPPNLSQEPPISPTKITRKAKIASDFEVFWEAYPRKVAKGRAEKAFPTAIAKTTLERLVEAAKAMGRNAEDPKFIPHPASWLNDKRWLDSTDPPEGVGTPTFDLAKHEEWVRRTSQIEDAA